MASSIAPPHRALIPCGSSSSGSYKTFEGQCEALTNALASRLGGAKFVVNENGDAFFEHAALIHFDGPAAQ